MAISPLHAQTRANAYDSAPIDKLERRLARFQPHVQPRVRALANAHPRLKDLALSFPALLFALALPREGFDPARSIGRVIDGAPLRELATLTGVPLWLRRVQPDGFKAPIPLLPDSEFYRRQIANYIPRSPKRLQDWLMIVHNAALWGDDAISAWIARETKTRRKPFPNLRRVCVWAWYSRHVGFEGNETRWSVAMTYDAAASASYRWREKLAFGFKAGGPQLADSWLEPGRSQGFDFVPIDTLEAMISEGENMENCVGGYASKVLRNQLRLWSVRKEGERVATLEIALPWDGPVPYVAQLKTKKNEMAPVAVWLAARAWLAEHDVERFDPAKHDRRRFPIDRKAWARQWKPYWLAKRRFPAWLPLMPTYRAIGNL